MGTMTNSNGQFQEVEPLNAEEFMWAVVRATPPIMLQINGLVDVAVRLDIDEGGQIVSIDVVQCKAIAGTPIRSDQPEIVDAAKTALKVLRFVPAKQSGKAVYRSGLEMSFGFSTVALRHDLPLLPITGRLN